MATISNIPGIKDTLYEKIVTRRMTYCQISQELQQLYPNIKGISARSIRRYCSDNGLHRTSRLTDHELDRVVTTSTSKV